MTDLKEPSDGSDQPPRVNDGQAASPAPSQASYASSRLDTTRRLSQSSTSDSSTAVPAQERLMLDNVAALTGGRSRRLPAIGLFRSQEEVAELPGQKRKRRLRAQLFWFLLTVLVLSLTAFGYTSALANAQDRLDEARQDRASNTDDDKTQDAEDTRVGQAAGSTKFIHALFCSALVVETFLVVHVAAKIGRYLIYRSYYKQQDALAPSAPLPLPATATNGSADGTGAPSARPPSRFVQALVGPPPRLPPPPMLPDYDHALRQAARQTARRQAARLGVSAGRRGREQFGSGDPEDLEVERIKRLGGLPPTYRSDEMRKSTVIMKGAKPERRSSILSMFSSSAVSNEDPTTPRSPSSQTGFTGFVQRLISVRRTSATGSNAQQPPSPRTPTREAANAAQENSHPTDLEKGDMAESCREKSEEKEDIRDEESVPSPAYPQEAISVILGQPAASAEPPRPSSIASRSQKEAIV